MNDNIKQLAAEHDVSGEQAQNLLEQILLEQDQGINLREHYGVPDPRDLVDVEIDLEDDLMLAAALMAHDEDITLNQFFVRVLEQAVQEAKNAS